MTVTYSSLQELLFPGLKAIFGMTRDQWETEFDQIFDTETSKRRDEDYLELVGTGLVPEKTSGAPTQYDDIYQGYKTTLQNLIYSLGIKVTREMHDDDQYREINKLPKALAISISQTVELLGARILDRAFNASYPGADASELCATDHPLPGGGTGANAPASMADLSMLSFEQMRIDVANFVDGRGLKMKALPMKLIVSPKWAATARTILESEGNPETANRSMNPFKGDVSLMISHFKADEDSWFVKTNQDGLICQKRVWPAEFQKDNDFDSDIAKFKTYFRLQFGWSDWRSIYGNSGDA